MTAIAEKLERKLKTWEPSTAKRVEKLVTEIIERADAEVATPPTVEKQKRRRPADAFFDDKSFFEERKKDPLFADTAVYEGKVPADLSFNHDKYLYDQE